MKHFHDMHPSRHGFSLVELSVVLVVIGLMVGGILGGRSLIKAAELREVIHEAETYQAALNTFVVRYEQYPGDMIDAQSFWGVAHATASTCRALDKLTVNGTCNGDGDQEIGGTGTAKYSEHYLFWHHLQYAGLIEGEYSGTWDNTCGAFPGSCLYAHTPGLNCPDSGKGSHIGWAIYFKDEATDIGGNWFLGDYGHIFTYGAIHTYGAAPNLPALTVGEVYSLDMKMDDGLPARGRLAVRNGRYPDMENCTETAVGSGVDTDANDIDSVYRLSESEGVHCNMILRNLLE